MKSEHKRLEDMTMDLKKQAENSKNLEEAGNQMEISDRKIDAAELDQVSGGSRRYPHEIKEEEQ